MQDNGATQRRGENSMPTKVLAIDDDSAMTELVAILLRSHGFEVITANNGLDGVECARNQFPDIVILDLMMPELDGWNVCRSIRSFSKIPIVILSAIDNPGSVSSALDAGADDYLIKPVPTGVLIAHINNLARRAIAQRDSRPIGRQTASLAAQNSWVSGD
jgi:DNA-binding response OmpR family regulator